MPAVFQRRNAVCSNLAPAVKRRDLAVRLIILSTG